ncbi:MAG: hypothetical protein LC117_05040, partial [Bacteroidia bacterium]|nr:hypothetical protein [Bacteroidia bacterium]
MVEVQIDKKEAASVVLILSLLADLTCQAVNYIVLASDYFPSALAYLKAVLIHIDNFVLAWEYFPSALDYLKAVLIHIDNSALAWEYFPSALDYLKAVLI